MLSDLHDLAHISWVASVRHILHSTSKRQTPIIYVQIVVCPMSGIFPLPSTVSHRSRFPRRPWLGVCPHHGLMVMSVVPRPPIESRWYACYGQVLQEAFAREVVKVVSAVNAAAKAKVRACNVPESGVSCGRRNTLSCPRLLCISPEAVVYPPSAWRGLHVDTAVPTVLFFCTFRTKLVRVY